MTGLDKGWIRYSDGVNGAGVKGVVLESTQDGGATWTPTSDTALAAEPTPAPDALEPFWLPPADKAIASLTFEGKEQKVRQAQFLTARIGWALTEERAKLDRPLLVTADGGTTWSATVTPDVTKAVQDELAHRAAIRREAALYSSPDAAKTALGKGWQLFPETTYPGDAVLVRYDGPGTVAWEGVTYKLQPYESGYFTYLPMPMSVKPGPYYIGDKTLTVKAKKFDTQYLVVTEQMEAMKQDTARIAADQKKIDLARSKSAPEFLFTSEFMKPIEGRLTTPYGYTRYVNNKYDSSHLAVDLAAPTGTPIHATNDGVVVLAEMLYLTGNAIYLDHGMGLFSQYAHMSELKVKVGDRVKKGDVIGLVGTTGFSTGPHLHFTFWMHNVQANPDLFFNSMPFRWALK